MSVGCPNLGCDGTPTGISTSVSDADEDSLEVLEDDEITCDHWFRDKD